MTDPIEHVAKAMEERRRELIHAPLARIWPELARAALEAVREPTDEMITRGLTMLHPDSGWGDAIHAWEEMLAALLGRTQGLSPSLDRALQDELDHPPAGIVKPELGGAE